MQALQGTSGCDALVPGGQGEQFGGAEHPPTPKPRTTPKKRQTSVARTVYVYTADYGAVTTACVPS